LFENGMQEFYNKIILVTAPKDIRIERIISRDGSTKQQVLERMGNQMGDNIKVPLADYVVANIDFDETIKKVTELNMALLAYY
jgi:dephospho-CoA kinase